MFKPSHLTDEAANVLAGTAGERVYFIQSKRWVAYPKAVQILDHLNKMLKLLIPGEAAHQNEMMSPVATE